MVEDIQVSVVICCYNSEARIRATLESLVAQDIPETICWEVILVDNNCTDRTVEVAHAVWSLERVPLRVVEESTPGLSSARDCGVGHSDGRYVLFCDDDNWLAPDYLRLAHEYLNKHPDYAAIGGWGDVVSDPDVDIPEWFEQFETKYACGKTGREGDVDNLVGAGMFIRKDALDDLRSSAFKSLLSDRKGTALSSGGDLELSLALRIRGWKLYFSEAMYFKHYMPVGRLTEEYLLRMSHGHGCSRPILSEYRRLVTGGAKSKGTLGLLPFRVGARFLKSKLPRLAQNKQVSKLEKKVLQATNKGAAESERELLVTGRVWRLADEIAANVKGQA